MAVQKFSSWWRGYSDVPSASGALVQLFLTGGVLFVPACGGVDTLRFSPNWRGFNLSRVHVATGVMLVEVSLASTQQYL